MEGDIQGENCLGWERWGRNVSDTCVMKWRVWCQDLVIMGPNVSLMYIMFSGGILTIAQMLIIQVFARGHHGENCKNTINEEIDL